MEGASGAFVLTRVTMSDTNSEAADSETAATDTPDESPTAAPDAATEPVETVDDDSSAGTGTPNDGKGDADDGDQGATNQFEDFEKPREFTAAIEAPAIQTTINTLTALVEEARFWLTTDGLHIETVDPANVAMDVLDLDAKAFESYATSEGVLGLNLDRLADITGMADTDDLVQFEYDAETGKLTIHIGGLEYTLAPIDAATIRSPPNDVPDLDFSAMVTLEGRDLNRGIRAADMVDDHVTLAVDADANSFHIMGEGDTDDVDLTLEQADLIDLVTNSENTEAIYSLNYLKDLNKTMPNGAELTLEFGTDFPLIITYKFANGDGDITRMLAPRIKSE